MLNNRKVKTSNRNRKEQNVLMCKYDTKIDISNEKNISHRNFGCKSLEIAYLASGKIDLFTIDKVDEKYFEPFYLIAEQASGQIKDEQGATIIENK